MHSKQVYDYRCQGERNPEDIQNITNISSDNNVVYSIIDTINEQI